MKIAQWFKWLSVVVSLVLGVTVCEAEISLDFPPPDESASVEKPSMPAGNAGLNAGAGEGIAIRPEAKRPLQLALDLTDGSHIIGVPSIRSLRINTSYAKMDVELAKISSIQIDHAARSASVSFVNGDNLKGELDVEVIEVKGLVGKCSIAMEHIVAMSVLTDAIDLPVSLRKGLVLYYSFDQNGAGGVVSDKSGKGNHGKVKGAKWFAGGNRGSYVFKDSNDEITGSDLHLPSGDSARSVSLWFKLNRDPAFSTGSFVAWGTVGQYNQYSGIGFDRRVDRYGVCFSQWGAVDVSSKKITSADEWHHCVFVYTGSGEMQFYVDNVDHGLQADEIRSSINTVPSGLLRIGGSEFNGAIGEVMIYDRALSGQEVDQIHNMQKNSFTP